MFMGRTALTLRLVSDPYKITKHEELDIPQ